jgi:hypothetical protein
VGTPQTALSSFAAPGVKRTAYAQEPRTTILAGRTADAIEHLGLTIDTSERFRSFTTGDSDFDAIREEPAFQALVAD